jgi:hypothetical protein
MTRDEIIRGMGWPARTAYISGDDDLLCRIESIVRSAEAAERKACAKLAESLPMQQEIDVRDQCAAAIRARGEK